METIGTRIRRLRKALGMDRQAQLSELVGITQSTLSDIESKNKDFSAQVLYKFASALMCSPEYIMTGEGEEDVGSYELMAIYKSITPDEREMLLKMARGLQRPDLGNSVAA